MNNHKDKYFHISNHQGGMAINLTIEDFKRRHPAIMNYLKCRGQAFYSVDGKSKLYKMSRQDVLDVFNYSRKMNNSNGQ